MAEANENNLIPGGTAKDYDKLYRFVDAINKLATDEETRQRISSLSPEAKELVGRISAGEVHTSVLCQIVSKYWKELGFQGPISESECYKLETHGRKLSADNSFPSVKDVDKIYNQYEDEILANKEEVKSKVSESRNKLSEARKKHKRFRVFGNVLKVVASAALVLATVAVPIGVFASVVFAPIATGLMTGLGITTILGASLMYKYGTKKATKLFNNCVDKLKKAREARKAERQAVREAKREYRKNKSMFRGVERSYERERNYRSNHKYPGSVKEAEPEPERKITTNVVENVNDFDKFMEGKGFSPEQVKLFNQFKSEEDLEAYCEENNLNFEEIKGKYSQFVEAKKEFEENKNENFDRVRTEKQETKQPGEQKKSETPNSSKQSETKEIHFENGDVYVGEVNEQGEPNGKGEVRFKDGKRLSGSFKNGKRNGYLELYDKDDKLIESYNCVEGKKHGRYVDGEKKSVTYYFEDEDVKTKEEFDRLTKEAEEKQASAEDSASVLNDLGEENTSKTQTEPQAGDAEKVIPQEQPTNDNDQEFVNDAEQEKVQSSQTLDDISPERMENQQPTQNEDDKELVDGADANQTLNVENASEKKPNKCWLAIQCFDAINGEPSEEQIEAIRKKTGFASLEDAKKAYAKTKKINVEEINLDPAEGKTPNRPWLAKTIGEVVGKDNLSENFKKRTGYDDPDRAKVEYAKQKFVKATKETLAIAGRNGWKTFTAKTKEDVSQMFEKLEQDKRSNIVSSLKGLSKEQIAVVLEGMPDGLKAFVDGQLKGKDESKQKNTSDKKIDKTELFKKFNSNRKASSGAHFTAQLTRDEFMDFVVKEGIAENGNNQQLKEIWQEYQQNEVKSATIDGEKVPEVQYSEDGTAFYAGEVKAEEVLEKCSENPTKEEYIKVAQEQGLTKVEAELSYHGEAEAKIETPVEEQTTEKETEETTVETPVEPETPAKKEEPEVQVEQEPVVKEEPVAPKVEIEVVQDQIEEEKPKTQEEIEEENRIASENRIKEFIDQYEQNVSDENETLFRDYAERNGLSPEEIENAVETYFKQEEKSEQQVAESENTEEQEEVVHENETKSTLEPQAGGAGNIIPPTPPTDDNDQEFVNVADQENVQPSQTPKDNLPEYMKTQELLEGMEIYQEEQDFIKEFEEQARSGRFKDSQEAFSEIALKFKFTQERINAMINQKYGDQNKNKSNSEEEREM